MDNLILEYLVDEYIYTKKKLMLIDGICIKYMTILKSITQPKLTEHNISSETISNSTSSEQNCIVDDVVIDMMDDDNIELKNIYKSIVKKIHPDINNTDIALYQDTIHFYENNDIFSLKIVANKLNISVDFDHREVSNKIYELNVKISNKMNSYEWLYANTTNDEEREILILEYISKQI